MMDSWFTPTALIFSDFLILPRFDLHCHSTCSDGLMRPQEIVARAAQRGVQTLALTDHDALEGLGEARSAAEAVGIEFVCGVEISVTWRGSTVHVVGLHIDPSNDNLVRGLAKVRNGRLQRAGKIAAGLADAGIEDSFQGALDYVTNPQLIGRMHFARFLAGRGYARDVQSAFKRYLTAGRVGFVPHQWAGLEQAITWINDSGGTAVLAHPARYALGAKERESLLENFTELGGRAIEVATGNHTRGQYTLWGSCARRYGLSASIGSDFHGPLEGNRDVGGMEDLPSGCTPVWQGW